MKVIFMAKGKVSSIEALKYLIFKKIKVVYAIVPNNDLEIKKICEENNIMICSDIELYEKIERKDKRIEGIDIVISFLFWKKIKYPIISLAKYGCINFHPAPLPEYRGLGGYNFAVLDELEYWGVSAHYVDEKIDTGKIIKTKRFPIDKANISALFLEKISQNKLLELYTEVIEELISNKKLNSEIQNEGRYITKLELEESKRVLLNDSKDIVDKKIRAFWFPPYTGAFIEIDGERYTLINEKILKNLK